MAAGNFDDQITINANGEILPSGPLGDFGNEPPGTVIHFYFWVIQLQPGQTAAFIQGTGKRSLADPTRWEAETYGLYNTGVFTPGPAYAQAVSLLDGPYKVDWWSEVIELIPAPAGGPV